MKLIVGLGNPGTQYEGTRHNIGFMIVDSFLDELKLGPYKEKFSGLVAQGNFEKERIAILKPLTYMNESGTAVHKILDYCKILSDDMIVVHDDIDLPFGRIKIKFGGGDGGHNGIKSIIEELGSNNFGRIRVGIGRDRDVTKHVLSNFSKTEKETISLTIQQSIEVMKSIMVNGYEKTMNTFNRFEN